jgi:hypothetical protein
LKNETASLARDMKKMTSLEEKIISQAEKFNSLENHIEQQAKEL